MFNHLFRQLFSSFGIFFRTIRAFFTRRFIGLGARLRRITNFSRHATKVASASFQGAATAMKKPTRREDYLETKWLFVSKSFLIKLLIGLVALGCLVYFVVWPFLLGKFFTAHFWEKDEKVEDWSGKVVVYYDEEKDHPKYEGRLEEGVLQGQGKEYDEDGLLAYEGGFVDGLYSGEGTLYEAGVLLYQGSLSAGLYEGDGVLYRDGVISYEGSFLQGVPHGKGKSYDETGCLRYEGGFQEQLYAGEGILYHPNGEVQYVGSFSGGKFDGEGKMMDENGQLIYEGSFANGQYDGEGTLYEEGQPIYIGGYAGGLREGEGEEYLPDGTLVYKGGYADDQWNGTGTEYKPDGTVRYKGEFADGKYEGSGVLYLDDERGRVEAVFADGEPDGTIQWYIDEKLWYSGGADGLIPDGHGELYTRSGKCVYAGEMDRGTIDGQWILGLSAEEVREAFAEATVAEKAAADGGFFVMNRELGLVVRCTYRSEDSETGVFSVWISRQDTEMAWNDLEIFDSWVKNLKTDTSMAELMPWPEEDAFNTWVQGLQEGGPATELTFPEHEMEKKRYYFDGWYCTAAIETASGQPVMVSWTVDGLLQPQEEGAALPEDVKAVQEAADTLVESLGLAPEEESEAETGMLSAESGVPAVDVTAPEEAVPEQSEPDEAQQALYELLLKKKTLASVKSLIDSLLDYEENARALAALQSTQAQSQSRLEDAKQRLAMGSGTQDEVDTLQLQADAYQLRISQSEANRAKALLALQELIEFDPAQQNLSGLLICFDPTVLVEEEVCAQAGKQDEVAAKASLINLKVAYETVQYAVKTLTKAEETANAAADAYSRGEADQLTLDDALCGQSDTVVQFYGALSAFTREVNTLNQLTGGWLASQVDWLSPVFDEIT